MNELDKLLTEDTKWQQKFEQMPIIGNCDSGCGEPATVWFGNTSCATCGKQQCIDQLQEEYDNM